MTHYLSPSVRRFGAIAAAAGLLTLYTGPVAAQRTLGIPPADAWTTMHVLNRIGFGARPGDLDRVKAQGLAAYIDEQLHPERIADTEMTARLAEFTTLTMDSRELAEKYFQPAQQLKRLNARATPPPANAGDPAMTMAAGNPPGQPQLTAEERMVRQAQQSVISDLMQAKMLRAVGSDRQLQEVLTDFWFNHFNVYIGKGQVREYLTEYERDAIRPHVLGKFRDLLGATAHSPAMLFYLDNAQSAAPNQPAMLTPEMNRRLNDPRLPPLQRQQNMQRLQQAQRQQPKGLNENYGRELMELHTLGVDGGYTQHDVVEVARALTGWTIDRQQGTFVFRPQMHDTKPKTILGVEFNGKGGQDEGERVLDLLAKHPSTAHHVAFELTQRFVADEPPASLVDRAAKVFLDTKGDLREVTRVIITSPEFFESDSYRAKVKTPFEFVVSAVRATGATITNAQPLVGQMNQLGMPLYGCQPPTGYSMTADAWVNTGALLNRMNFALQLVGGGGAAPGPQGRGGAPGRPNQPPPGGRIGQPPPAGAGQPPQRPLAGQGQGPGRGMAQLARQPMQVDLRTLAPDTTEASRDHLIALLLAGRASDGTMKTLARAENPQQLVALTLGSPEFQRR